MIFQGREEHYLLGLSLDEMKIIYRSMWNDLKSRQQFGEDEAATDLLFELQTLLQREATRTGVNVGDHSQWAAFVGIDESCRVRPKQA